MSQVVSKGQRSNDVEPQEASQFRRPFLVAFHGAMASTYGYALSWQSVSGKPFQLYLSTVASAELYAKTNPLMRVFGKWRFLTYHCLVVQFVAYSLCFTSHFVPRLRRPRDFFFTTFAFPMGMVVVISFWSIWAIAGRENIFPSAMEPFYPVWLNHITHTIIAPVNLAELVLVKHKYLADRKSITPLAGYIVGYTSFFLYIRFQTGRFVYPFLNKMDAVSVGAYLAGTVVFTVIMYKSGKFLSNLVHGVKSIRDNRFGKKSKKI